jgi:hypothetical protein
MKRIGKAASSLLVGALCVGALASQGCEGADKLSEAQSELCCTEFQVGGSITADLGGGAEGQVAAQAVADFAGIASAAVDDLTAACRSIAQDLDVAKADQDAAEATKDKRARMNVWCQAAVSAIGTFKASAGGTLTVNFVPPVCSASISAKANCQAQCSGSASCDLKANPPTCTGGRLEVACKGECTAKAGATLSCEGTCNGSCQGSCTAMGGVECAGKCDGTCTASAGGSGPQADGTCQGSCAGTCEVTAPSATCSGSCKGTCSASCTGSATASVKCDGECAADYEPIKCEGGELSGGCQAEAKCEGNCDASVQAKAECKPPTVTVAFTGAANAEAAGKLEATLRANLGVVLAFKARLEGMAKITGSLVANIEGAVDVKASCLIAMVAAAAAAVEDVQASVTVSANVAASTN